MSQPMVGSSALQMTSEIHSIDDVQARSALTSSHCKMKTFRSSKSWMQHSP